MQRPSPDPNPASQVDIQQDACPSSLPETMTVAHIICINRLATPLGLAGVSTRASRSRVGEAGDGSLAARCREEGWRRVHTQLGNGIATYACMSLCICLYVYACIHIMNVDVHMCINSRYAYTDACMRAYKHTHVF